MLNVRLIIEQLKIGLKVKTDKELCEKIEMPPQTLSGWKTRNTFPLEVAVDLSQKYDLDLNWLVTGESKEKQLDTAERMLLTAFADLNDAQKMQAVTFVGNLASGNPTAQTGGVNQSVSHSKVKNIAGGNVQQGARFYFEDDE